MNRPIRSNTSPKDGCNPVSSNCVEWEGHDLDGIVLCDDDSVSDVIEKVNKVLQAVKKELDLSDLDITTLLDTCAACPEPAKTLFNVLTLIINKIATLEELIG